MIRVRKGRREKATCVVECCMPASCQYIVTCHIVQELTNRGRGPPAEQFADGSTNVGQTLPVSERGHARATDDRVQLFLTFLLHLWVRNHG